MVSQFTWQVPKKEIHNVIVIIIRKVVNYTWLVSTRNMGFAGCHVAKFISYHVASGDRDVQPENLNRIRYIMHACVYALN